MGITQYYTQLKQKSKQLNENISDSYIFNLKGKI